MTLTLNILAGVFCLPLLLLGLRSMFKPASMAEAMAIAPQGAAGLNTVRGVIGGLFFACVLMLVLGLATGQTLWFLAVTIVMVMVVLGRVVGIVGDGFEKAVVAPLIIEVVIAGVLGATHVVQGVG